MYNFQQLIKDLNLYAGCKTPPFPVCTVTIVVIQKTTDDEISPSLHSRTDLVNTDTLSDENLTMAGIGRNM